MYQPLANNSGNAGTAQPNDGNIRNWNGSPNVQPTQRYPLAQQNQGNSQPMMNGGYSAKQPMNITSNSNGPLIGAPLGGHNFNQNAAGLSASQVLPQLTAPLITNGSQLHATQQQHAGHVTNGYNNPISTVAQPTSGSVTESARQQGPGYEMSTTTNQAQGKRRAYPNQSASGFPMNQQQGFAPNNIALSPNSPTPYQGQAYSPSPVAGYPNQFSSNQQPRGQVPVQPLTNAMGNLTVEPASTFPTNLMEQRCIISTIPTVLEPPPLQRELIRKVIDQSVFCSTLNAVPETASLLGKCKLPFGIHIHPFKEIKSLPIVSPSVIARCKSCRTYLNPFVGILDGRRWQCNMCFRTNEIPEELCFDYNTKTYADPRRRPELNCSSLEFIAPSEYMLRPPQPSVFLFVLDVSLNALSTGYLQSFCKTIKSNLKNLPGDSRTLVGFITFNSSLHFYSLKETQTQPHCYVVSDLEDPFLPAPDGLVVNLKENFEMVEQLLDALPAMYSDSGDTLSACGAALSAARKLLNATGGRITLFQTTLPSIGPGKLEKRGGGHMQAGSKDVAALNPATDFYKKFALDCAGEQIGVDLFFLASQYADLASLSCASKYSSGCIHRFPDFHVSHNPAMVEKFTTDLSRYLTRDIGFEAVMRIRCTKGLSIHTFHGNFFVRSTDLLSLPNVNPDHGFSMQISIDDSLTESSTVGFQAALLYTTSHGERRIRVHTLALPVTRKISDVYSTANESAIAGLLSIMAVDRTVMSSLGDAREALMNACIDSIGTYRSSVINQRQSGDMVLGEKLKLLPLHILAMLKHDAFQLGDKISLDARVDALQQLKILPLAEVMLYMYPRLYSLLDLVDEEVTSQTNGKPFILPATSERLDHRGIFLLDAGKKVCLKIDCLIHEMLAIRELHPTLNVQTDSEVQDIYILVGKSVASTILKEVFKMEQFNDILDCQHQLPASDGLLATAIVAFIDSLRRNRTQFPILTIFREDSPRRSVFLNRLVDDRSESSMSYREFLLHVQRQLNR